MLNEVLKKSLQIPLPLILLSKMSFKIMHNSTLNLTFEFHFDVEVSFEIKIILSKYISQKERLYNFDTKNLDPKYANEN